MMKCVLVGVCFVDKRNLGDIVGVWGIGSGLDRHVNVVMLVRRH